MLLRHCAIALFVLGNLGVYEQETLKETHSESQVESTTKAHEPISLYRDTYLLGGYDSSGLSNGGVLKYQLSVKINTVIEGLYFGYTQRSFMDVFADSFPFYDHNFSPEIFYRPAWVSLKNVYDIQTGLLHESNGLNAVKSRSWNRVYLEARIQFWEFYIRPVLWVPFLSKDNLDVKQVYGFGETTLGLLTPWHIEMSLRCRLGKTFKKGNLLLDFSMPFTVFDKINPKFANSQMWFQSFYGQGETLLGLDRRSLDVAIGIGFRPKLAP